MTTKKNRKVKITKILTTAKSYRIDFLLDKITNLSLISFSNIQTIFSDFSLLGSRFQFETVSIFILLQIFFLGKQFCTLKVNAILSKTRAKLLIWFDINNWICITVAEQTQYNEDNLNAVYIQQVIPLKNYKNSSSVHVNEKLFFPF